MLLDDAAVPRSSLAEVVCDRILNAIMMGEIRPGEPIKEAVIARQLKVSRGPLREALSRLEGRQLVERIPGVGARVISLSRDDLVSLFEIRASLEGLACKLAATRMSDSKLAELEAFVTMNVDVKSEGGGYNFDDDFHIRIAEASRNARLIKMLTQDLYYPMRLYRYRSGRRKGRIEAAFREHATVVKALKSRDPDIAEWAMRQHISNAMQSLLDPSEEVATADSLESTTFGSAGRHPFP